MWNHLQYILPEHHENYWTTNGSSHYVSVFSLTASTACPSPTSIKVRGTMYKINVPVVDCTHCSSPDIVHPVKFSGHLGHWRPAQYVDNELRLRRHFGWITRKYGGALWHVDLTWSHLCSVALLLYEWKHGQLHHDMRGQLFAAEHQSPPAVCGVCLLSRWNKWDGQRLRGGRRGVRGASRQAGEIGAWGDPGDPGRGTRGWVTPCGGGRPAKCPPLSPPAPAGPLWSHPYPLHCYSHHPPLQRHRQHLRLRLSIWGHDWPCQASLCCLTLHISFSA